MSNVNDNIRKFRKFRRMSQKELGQRLNKSTNVVSNWENGIHSPDLDTIEEICKILKVSPDEIFGWKENKEFENYLRHLREYQYRIKNLMEEKEKIEKQISALEAQKLKEFPPEDNKED